MNLSLALLFILLGYLVGSIPTGWIVARWRGVDIQKVGSGNIGATNVLRSMGVVPAVFVMVFDPLKGALITAVPVLLGHGPWVVALTALAAVLGNNFNVFLRFRGGKGVATSLGVFLVIDPVVSLLSLAVAIAVMALGRYVSLGSLVGILMAPLFVLARPNIEVANLALTVALAALSFYRHRENVRRLQAGTERRLGEPKTEPEATP